MKHPSRPRGAGKVPFDPEILAIQALAFVATDEEGLARFMAETGCDPSDLRSRAADPAFLGGVLDFILAWEPRLLAFAENTGVAPEMIAKARSQLPGGLKE